MTSNKIHKILAELFNANGTESDLRLREIPELPFETGSLVDLLKTHKTDMTPDPKTQRKDEISSKIDALLNHRDELVYQLAENELQYRKLETELQELRETQWTAINAIAPEAQ